MVNLEDHDTALKTSPISISCEESEIIKVVNQNSPCLSVLIAEVDQAGNVEQELDKVVQHEQDQTQTVQTERHKQA